MDLLEPPVVDLNASGPNIKIDDIPDRQHVVKELQQALREIGFVYLVNHGISQEKIDCALEIERQYFNLADSTKRKHKWSSDTLFGHITYGGRFLERHGQLENRESYDTTLSKSIYPSEIPDLKEVMEDLVGDLVHLSLLLCQLIAEGLGLPFDTFTNAHKKIHSEDNHSILRLLHYPPMTNVEDNCTRCGIHTDKSSLTLILQDDIGGLKVRKGEHEWIDAKPVPGAVLMNIGELLEIWTGGELKATEHEVSTPSDPWLLPCPRYSIGFFLITDHDAMVKPLVGDKNSYKAVNGEDYVYKKLNRWYN